MYFFARVLVVDGELSTGCAHLGLECEGGEVSGQG